MFTRRNFLVGTVAAIVSATLPCAVKAGEERKGSGEESLTIIQWCDPQIGFSQRGCAADIAIVKKIVGQINALKPDLLVVAGDLVNANDEKTVADFKAAIAAIDVPYVLTPGNHDIQPPVTGEKLGVYRRRYGPDRKALEIKGVKVIAVNSVLWMPKTPQNLAEEHNAWLHGELLAAKEGRIPVILLSHIPPFVKVPDEKDGYSNVPLSYRETLLDLCADHGVIFFLSGHTHTVFRGEYRGTTFLRAETTSKNFDKRPFGFRVLKMPAGGRGAFTWDFVPVDCGT